MLFRSHREQPDPRTEAIAALRVEGTELVHIVGEQLDEQRGVDLADVVLAEEGGEPAGHLGDAAVDEAVVALVELSPSPLAAGKHVANERALRLDGAQLLGVIGNDGGGEVGRASCRERVSCCV